MDARLRGLTLALVVLLLAACRPAAEAPAEPPASLWQGQTYDGSYAIEVNQPRGLLDAPIAIRVTGLRPGQPVTVRGSMTLQGRAMASWATFAADESGAVDVTKAAPIHGTYVKSDAMGLFWSMARVETAAAAVPSAGGNPVAPLEVTLTAEAAGRTLASRQIERRFYDETQVTRRPVREAGIVATLFTPKAAGPHPAVIWLGGSDGGLAEGFAALLASHGFAALSLAYFGIDPLPPQLVEIPLESLKAGIDWLKTQPEVDGQRIGLMGVSKGAELALLLAATYGDDIRAVVAHKPSSVVWLGLPANPADSFRGPKSSWTKDGRPLPFVSGAFTFELIKAAIGRPAAMVSSYEKGLQNAEAVAAAAIPVERIRGPVLLVAGAADLLWPSAQMAGEVMKRLDANGFPYRHESLVYKDAGHGLGLPYTPTTLINSGTLLLGGTPEATAAANADAWPKMIAFLEEALGLVQGG